MVSVNTHKSDIKTPCPALMIAAPSSGSGKTTLTAGLAWHHRRQGRRVKIFKCGPDFIDPMLLTVASGSSVDNLDLWMVGEDLCRQHLYEAACQYDLILIEAVMGLFDGEPSAAHLALRFGLPVLAMIDASAMAQTFAALAFGLKHYEPKLNFFGAVANKVAGAGHAHLLESCMPPDTWLGWLPQVDPWPERHLGLALPHELPDLEQRLDQLADMISEHAMAKLPPSVEFEPVSCPVLPTLLQGRRVAIARDAAFCFIYPANLTCLQALGAELLYFSPTAHDPLPDADALWLPGGYPELHAQALSTHPTLANELHTWRAAGKPILAECGGMLVLAETLSLSDGSCLPMWGLLAAKAIMNTRLSAVGPQAVDLGLGPLRGHTFHYSTLDTSLPPATWATSSHSVRRGEAVYRDGSLTASYVHLWFSSHPAATAALLGA
ncbi:MAG: cobyrinate a,c-diamide synthase [Pseudomonadales bacterium]|nr:cobyrinate a,c-diamide synthase [Pseudomonadales bacterium]